MGSSPERLHREERSGQPPVLRADRFNTVRPRPGRGRKVNVLDSFGYRMRVVITSEGVEGLPAVDWVHARMSEDSAGLIERALELLARPRPAEPPAGDCKETARVLPWAEADGRCSRAN